jgi:hypothetical protein
MALSPSIMPVRWHSGPLDIARREKSGDLTPQARNCLQRWHEPAALDLLKNTPIDCIVLSWAAGLPEDVAQQKTAGPLVETAHKNNLAVVGWVEEAAAPETAIAAAKSAGLSAVAVKNFKGKSEFPIIPWGSRETVPWDSTAAVLPLRKMRQRAASRGRAWGGTRDLNRIEVIGTPIKEAQFKFRQAPGVGDPTRFPARIESSLTY